MSRGLLVVEKDDSLFDSNIQTECDVAELLNNESSQRRNTSSAVSDAPKCTIPKHPLYSVEDIKKSTKATSHPLF